MDFSVDGEQKALGDAVRALAQRHAPEPGADAQVGPGRHRPEAWTALAELGALGLPFSADAGGLGASAVEAGLVATELGRAGLVTVYADVLVAGSLLETAGAVELLGSLAEGTAVVLPVLAEPNRAWSLTSSGTEATGEGDSWSLTGNRGPVVHAEAATHVVVPATTPEGLALFLVEGPTFDQGVLRLDGTAATRLLDAAATPAALRRAVGLGTTVVCAEALGAMESALDMTTEYLKTRKQFGVPLMTFQTLTQRAADMYVSLELARSAVLFGLMTTAEEPDDAVTPSRVKAVVGTSGRHIAQEAIQLHGGIGVTAEYAVGHRATRLTAIEQTLGSTRDHLAALSAGVGGYEMVDILA